MRKSLSSRNPFLLLLLNKKNKNEHTEYHGKTIPFKSQAYSNMGVSVWVMEVLVEANFFLKIWTCQTLVTFNVTMKTVNKLCISDRVYTLFKKTFLLFNTALLKCFIYSRVAILDSPWSNNPCCAYQELGQGDFYSLEQEKVPFLLIYLLPTHKNCNHKKNHIYLNLIYSICHRVDIYRLA